MAQQIFSGTDYGFKWTADGWYTYDGKIAEKTALIERNALAKELKSKGMNPVKFSLPMQLVSRGGIGSGKPHIELYTRSYGVNW
jgi:hypothetical protein